ncbi:two-component system LytT family response regulator [Arcicella aurantiaca]|uniref:Two-component system LytT family response regulator n=1 Tax=Arcicella aurantiaca TaxID=591202 RepID=A0A316EGP3_9BACT|nr:LytTR family DNA-binding domain-containing protein [Arcicella aurantiaca]PWK27907.1 two-component system LytT family response regulator [Arcicella aurantiaca]
MSNLIFHHGKEHLVVDYKRKIVLLVEKIIMLEGLANYTVFHLDGGRKRLFSHTLMTYQNDLAQHGFLRVHRSFIINPNYIHDFKMDDKELLMENNLVANVSRRIGNQQNVKKMLSKFCSE